MLKTSINIELHHNAIGHFSLVGHLVFDSISTLFSQYNELLKDSQQINCIVIDCTKLQRIDSAGLALLLDWKKQLKCKHKQLQLHSLPKQALALIQALHLQHFFNHNVTPT